MLSSSFPWHFWTIEYISLIELQNKRKLVKVQVSEQIGGILDISLLFDNVREGRFVTFLSTHHVNPRKYPAQILHRNCIFEQSEGKRMKVTE